MKIFIDTANLDMIKEINSWGILDGVTTNPSLVAKENTDTPTRVRSPRSSETAPYPQRSWLSMRTE